jgi:hypothetical protein
VQASHELQARQRQDLREEDEAGDQAQQPDTHPRLPASSASPIQGVIRRTWGSGAERQVVDKRASVLLIAMAGLNFNKNALGRIFLRVGNRPAFG